MANYSNIRNKIISDIKPNNNQEITGQIMQDTLLQMVSLLQDGGYLFKGGATTTTNPIVGDSNVFYLASVKGTYANFGGLQVNDNELAALVYNGSWSKISIDNQIAHLKDIWNVEYLPVFFLRVEFSNDTIAKISIDDVITNDFEAIIDDLINKTAFIFAYNSVNGSSEVNEFLSPVSVRKIEAGDSVEFIFDGINRNRYRVVVNYKDLSIQNQARQLIFLPNVSTFQDGLMSKEDKTKLDGIEVGANKYTLPVATASILGGIKSGGDVSIGTDGTVTVNNATNVENVPVATTSKIGGVVSGGDITVRQDGQVLVEHATEADTATNIPVATTSKIGGIKAGGDITVNSDGSVIIQRASTADNAENDENGDNIVNTYLKKSDIINGDSKVIHYVNSTYGSYFKIGHLTRNVEKGCVTLLIGSQTNSLNLFYIYWFYSNNESSAHINIRSIVFGSTTNGILYHDKKSGFEYDLYFSTSDNDYPVITVLGTTADFIANSQKVSSIPSTAVAASASVLHAGSIYGTSATLAGDLQFASYGNSGERGIKAVMTSNDYWGIVGRSTEDNQGILEIYTGDDGGSSTYNEIVKFSQYAGARTVESKPVKEFVVFDKSGNTSIPGVVSMGSTLTLRGNKGNADVFTDFNGGRGIVIRVTDSSGVLHELGMWNNGTPNYIKGNTRYNLYHAGNLGIATSTKSGLVKSGGDITVGTDGTVSVNKSKVADNANKLGNYGLFTSSSGSPAGHVPLIGADGVMEAGCYIDFHANGDTSDYNLRLMYDEDTDKKLWIKFPKASGTMALMNLIDSEDSAITIKSNCADFPAIDITAGITGNGMRITMSDAVDTGKLEFDGNLVWIDKQTDTSATLYVSDDVLYCNKDISSKGFYQSSDIRIKKNIREICRNDNRLEMAGDLSLKEFDMAGTERHAFGFIAQEVREKFPELVSEDKNGFLSLDYTSLLLLKIGFLEKKLSEVMTKLNNMDKRTNH